MAVHHRLNRSSRRPPRFDTWANSFPEIYYYITENIESNMTLFADDAFVLKKSNDRITITSTLNNDVIKIGTWSNQWLVIFSEIKCKFMLVTNKKRSQANIQITFNNILLDKVSEHTSLGLTISNQMSWASHISKLYFRKSK